VLKTGRKWSEKKSVEPGTIRQVYETPKLTSQRKRTPELKQCHVTGLIRRFYDHISLEDSACGRERQWEDRNNL